MSDLFDQLADVLTSLGTWGYFLIALIVFFETVIGIGQFLPGSVLLAFVGFLCYLQTFDITFMFFVVFAAHYAGEQTNYFLGKAKGAALFREDALVLRPALLEIVEKQLQKWGAFYFILCRFSGVLRPVLSFLAGSSRYPWFKFSLWLLPACAIWSFVHLGVGFALGASWHEAAKYVEEFSLLTAVTLISLGAAVWLSRIILVLAGATARKLEQVAGQIANSDFYLRLRQKSPILFSFLERRLSLTTRWGWYATIRFFLAGLLLGTTIALGLGAVNSKGLSYLDTALVNFLAQVRRPTTAEMLAVITTIGSPRVILSVALIASIACFFTKLRDSALLIFSSPLIALLTNCFVKLLIQRPRPLNDSAIVSQSYSFPSGHSAISTAFLLVTVYLIWQATQDRRVRIAWTSICLTLTLLIGYSRVYLAMHYATDVAGGLLIGLVGFILCSTFVTQFKHRESEPSTAKAVIATMAALAVVIGGSAYRPVAVISYNLGVPLSRCVQNLPHLSAVLPHLPRYATRLTGTPSLATNVIVVGQVESLVQELHSRGWETVAPQAFYTREIQAPVFPAFVQAEPARVTLVERSSDRRHVLRLWHTKWCVQDKPVWIGVLISEKLKRRFLTLEIYKVDADIDLVLERWCSTLSSCKCQIHHGFRERGLYHTTHPFFTHGIAAIIETHDCAPKPRNDGPVASE